MAIKPVSGEIKSQDINDNLSYLDSKFDQINGGPKETFTSVPALQSKYPNGANSAMLVTDASGANGYLYTWNGSAWAKGPLYQSQGIAPKTIGTKEVKKEAITPAETNFLNQTVNLFNKEDKTILNGKMLDYQGIIVDFQRGSISHAIQVETREVITAIFSRGTYGSNTFAHFYDESMTYITKVGATFIGDSNIGTFTIPNNPVIKYLKINIETININTLMVVKGDIYPSTFISYGYPLSNDVLLNDRQISQITSTDVGYNALRGKIAVFDGDSIANAINDPQDGWAGRIAGNNGMLYTNYAKDGGTITAGLMAGSNPRHWVSRSVFGYRDDADYIILEGGANDADLIGVSNIGTVSVGFNATLDDTTFTGAVESTLRQTILKYPSKKIGFIIAHKMGSMDQQTVRRAFFERIIECCEKWGIPYIDIWGKSYLNPELADLKAIYYSDNQHLTTAGYNLITPMIEKWMQTL